MINCFSTERRICNTNVYHNHLCKPSKSISSFTMQPIRHQRPSMSRTITVKRVKHGEFQTNHQLDQFVTSSEERKGPKRRKECLHLISLVRSPASPPASSSSPQQQENSPPMFPKSAASPPHYWLDPPRTGWTQTVTQFPSGPGVNTGRFEPTATPTSTMSSFQ